MLHVFYDAALELGWHDAQSTDTLRSLVLVLALLTFARLCQSSSISCVSSPSPFALFSIPSLFLFSFSLFTTRTASRFPCLVFTCVADISYHVHVVRSGSDGTTQLLRTCACLTLSSLCPGAHQGRGDRHHCRLHPSHSGSRNGSCCLKAPVFVIDGCCAMSGLLAWRTVPMATGGRVPFCARVQTTFVEVEDLRRVNSPPLWCGSLALMSLCRSRRIHRL